MMKKLAHILAVILGASALCSCYKDLSTEATTELPDIVISTESDVLNIAYGHELIVEPEVFQEGRSDEDFEYYWEIDLTSSGRNVDRIDIGTEKKLVYRVGNSPATEPYYLYLRVTDRVTGLQKFHSWAVFVSSSLGEGILVAHTSDGGKTSDIDLIAAKPVTYGYASDTPLITRDLYSFANGAPIEGRVNSLLTSVVTDGAVFNTTRIMVATDEHLIALRSLDYKESERDVTLFNSKETEFGTTMLFNFGDYCTAAVVKNRLFACIGNFDRAYTKVPISSRRTDVFHKYNVGYSKPDQGKILVFNEEDSKFHFASVLSVNGGMSSIDNLGLDYSLNGARPMGGGALKNQDLAMLMSLTDGTYHIYRFDLSAMDPKPIDYLLTNAKDIDKAISFAFCDNTDVMYYSTSDKIYAVLLSGGKASVKSLTWQPDSKDEKITSVSQFAQSWYGTSHLSFGEYPFTLDTHRLQIIITTYNASTGESKVYLRPFSVSTGLFTMKDNGSYKINGEITAITTTPR